MVKQVGWRILLHPRNSIRAAIVALLLGVCAAVAPHASHAQALPAAAQVAAVRLRIAWGGGKAAPWHGELRLSAGQFEDHRSLGIKSRAAAVTRRPDTIQVQSSQPIVYEAFDVTIRAPQDAQLMITLSRTDRTGAPTKIALPLASLVQREHNQTLDGDGNRLLIQRSPGDELQVALDRDHLVFSPGETWVIGVRPTLTSIPSDNSARLTVQVLSRHPRRSTFKEQHDLRPLNNGQLSSQDRIEIPIPDAEGVYDLIVSLDEHRVPALFRETAHIERAIQFVVVSHRPPEINSTVDWGEVLAFDAAQPRWWESLTRLPAWSRLPLSARNKVSEGDARPWQHQGRLVNRLLPGQRQAYPLPLAKVGVPYILEVECPADARQSLSVSLVEPELESRQHVTGVAVEPDPMAGAVRDGVRIVFWPQTRVPYVMLENVGDTKAASFETIRLFVGPDHLPADDRRRPAVGHRQALAYFGAPTYPAIFSASQAREESSGRQLTDWWTFLEGSQRFVEYLQFAGYTGATVGALVDGSTIFPAPALDPASRFDTGAYFNNGQDPIQKDALELLFRLFDRERLQLVPLIRLSTPIPQLEQLAQSQRDHGIRLVDRHGQPYVASDGFLLYNPLDPQVQAAVASILEMVVDRYAHHESFGGICLELGPNTFAQLPGINWGFDAATVGRFVQETQETQTAPYDQAFIASLREGALRERWVTWRSSKMTALYQNFASRLAQSRPDARLYLAAAKLLDAPSMQDVYQPVLGPRKKFDQALREMGLDFHALAEDHRIRISRPYCDVPASALLRQASALELAASEETDRRYRESAQRTGQAFTRSRRVTWAEPTAESPEPPALNSARVDTSVSGAGRRARLIESLAALDADVLFDGSELGGTAMADQVQRQLRVFSHLPAEPFEVVPAVSDSAESAAAAHSSPVVVRQLSRGDRTTVYAVNVAPWPVKASIRVAAPAGTRMRPVCDVCPTCQWRSEEADYLWQFELEPYDLQAAVISSGQARVTDVATELPIGVGPMLQSKLAELVVRVGQLKEPVSPLRLANAGFESVVRSTAAAVPAPFDGWELEGSSVHPDSTVRRTGKTSMKITSAGSVAWARSARFAPPKTGRLSVHVWVRSEADQPVPPLRLAIEGRIRDQPYYRYANITEVAAGASPPSPLEWREFVLHVDDLPSLELEYLQVRFDLMGQGAAWLDDVSVYGMSFTRAEHHELSRIIATADLQLREGRVTDCARTLQRYWPRLLAEQFPSAPRLATRDKALQSESDDKTQSPLGKFRKLVPHIRRLH